MREMAVTEAKARLAHMLRSVERGETIAITRCGRRIAHLVPVPAQNRFRQRRARWTRAEMSTAEILAARILDS